MTPGSAAATLEIDAQPSIETPGLGLADAKALLARMQAEIVMRRLADVDEPATDATAVA